MSSTRMKNDLHTLPWADPAHWREAREAMSAAVGRHVQRLQGAARLAGSIEKGITRLDDLMSRLCDESCPVCKDPCCGRATVWYDFKDLLYLGLKGTTLPAGQIVTAKGRPCAHLTYAGCALPRTDRPFICTWYLCPQHKSMLGRYQGASVQRLTDALTALKQARNQMEALFIEAVAA